jgi:tetratricopeptide (TPR) repeat protein
MWRARPVFLSSTFNDMQAERDALRSLVFPELEERLRAGRVHLEWVDLRIGVTAGLDVSEAEHEVQVLKVCLDEIRRCRPFLVVLLGDRYGWVPPPGRLIAAVGEEGFAVRPGCSVTELEIDFGILSDEEQLARSRFYFRDPLPYADMRPEIAAAYSDARAGNLESAARLDALKATIALRYPDRVRHYAPTWDRERARVTGLEEWARTVAADLWTILEIEISQARLADAAPRVDPERVALDDYIEETGRDFVGRAGILARLTGFAEATEAVGWGMCVAAEPGAGKSALFSTLCRRLARGGAVVLAHSAAAGQMAGSVDAMLARWNRQLGALLGMEPGRAIDASAAELEATFASLLARAAEGRRVMILVDALDQFEDGARGRSAAWLPRALPSNARVIATTLPGPGAESLAARGADVVAMPPLDAREARSIIEGICSRYHRAFEPAVMDALLGRWRDARGNPLWLVLAAEELNLVDAEDFTRARSAFSGAPVDQLRAMMVARAGALPETIAGLYESTFREAAALFGGPFADAFLWSIGISRSGWRDADLRAMLPALSGEAWDELRFASLRRIFRGQLRRRGADGRLAFGHRQMTAALRLRALDSPVDERAIHVAIVDRVFSHATDDPRRESETMVHLLASQDSGRSARYYGGELTAVELADSTRVLSENPERAMLLLGLEGDTSFQEMAAQRMLHLVLKRLRLRAPLAAQMSFAPIVLDFFESLIPRDPGEAARYAAQKGAVHDQLGDILFECGDLEGAEAHYRAEGALARASVGHFSGNEERRDLGVICNKIGRIRAARGDTVASARSYAEGLALVRAAAESEPEREEWQRDLAIGLRLTGDVSGAFAIFEDLADRQPEDWERQRDLAAAYVDCGDAAAERSDPARAEAAYASALRIVELHALLEPESPAWRLMMAQVGVRRGRLRMEGGDLGGSATLFREATSQARWVAAEDPQARYVRRTLLQALVLLRKAQANSGDLTGAQETGNELRALQDEWGDSP